jgi:HTH-type transcriptional regulator, sugar sensing transcriptional regulator
MDLTILEDLGLTQAEIKVYLTLLELGTSTAGNVLEKSKVQSSVMHRALNSLTEKGLINYILEGKRRIYQATQPENFHNFIEEKKRRFDLILPELKKKQTFAKRKDKATVFRGKRGINEVYNIMINTGGKEYNTFGGGTEVTFDVMGKHWWENLHLKRIEKKINSRQVFDETIRSFGIKLNKGKLTKIKFLPSEFNQLTETVIVGNKVALVVFTENPYAFLIEDKVVADGYRKHFEVLWKLAKK